MMSSTISATDRVSGAPASIHVTASDTDEIVYTGPPLIRSPVLWRHSSARRGRRTPHLVRAAMAHLNLVMIHPFATATAAWLGAFRRWFSPAAGGGTGVHEHRGVSRSQHPCLLRRAVGGRSGLALGIRRGTPSPWVRFCLRRPLHPKPARCSVAACRRSRRFGRACLQLAGGARTAGTLRRRADGRGIWSKAPARELQVHSGVRTRRRDQRPHRVSRPARDGRSRTPCAGRREARPLLRSGTDGREPERKDPRGTPATG